MRKYEIENEEEYPTKDKRRADRLKNKERDQRKQKRRWDDDDYE